MELHRYLSILRRRIVYVLVAVLATTAAAFAATPKTAEYSAKSVIYVGARQFSLSPDARYTLDPTLLVERLMTTYAVMLDSEPVASDALQLARISLSAEEVVERTSVTPEKDTQLLTVKVTDPVPEQARRLADAIAQAFVEKVQTVESETAPAAEGTLPGLPANVFQRAKLPTSPDPTGLVTNMVLAGLFGLLSSIGLVFVLEYLDLTIKSPAEAERRLQLPVLAVIPLKGSRGDSKLLPSLAEARGDGPERIRTVV